MSTMVTDTSIVLTRELRPLVRSPFSVIFTMVQPLVFLALFGPLLSQVTGLDTGSSLQWFVPGIIVMSALFGASSTGANLLLELQTGSHDRMLVTPIGRSALLVGRAMKEIVPVLAQAVIILAVVLPFGFRLEPVGVLLGLALVAASPSAWARCPTPWRWPRRTTTSCSGACSRPCCSRCCSCRGCCCRSTAFLAGCARCRRSTR